MKFEVVVLVVELGSARHELVRDVFRSVIPIGAEDHAILYFDGVRQFEVVVKPKVRSGALTIFSCQWLR